MLPYPRTALCNPSMWHTVEDEYILTQMLQIQYNKMMNEWHQAGTASKSESKSQSAHEVTNSHLAN